MSTLSTGESAQGIGGLRLPPGCRQKSGISDNFNYYGAVEVEDSQADFFEEKVQPINGFTSDPYEFVFEPMGDTFLCLNSMYLHYEARITKDGVNVDRNEPVAITNYPIASIWKSVETKLNNVVINPTSSYLTAYKSYIDAALSVRDPKSSYLRAGGFAIDDPDKYDTHDDTNSGYKYRRNYCNGQRFNFTGKICSDFLCSNNHLAPGNKLSLRFTRMPDAFCLNTGTDTTSYRLEIKEIAIYVRRLNLFSNAIPKILDARRPQRYSTIFTEMRDFPLAAGLKQWSTKISGGLIPKSLMIAFVETEAQVGSFKLNPFNFKHFDLSRINLKVNGKRVPEDPLRPDFENKRVSQAFNHLFMNTGKYRINSGSCLTLDQFQSGLTIFPFDLTPDQCNSYHSHAGREGTVEVELEWSKPLPKGITVLCYQVSQQVIQLQGENSPPSISTY